VIESSSFLSEYLTENQIEGLVGLINPARIDVLTSDDLAKLSQEKFVHDKEKEMLEKVTKIAEKEAEEKIKIAMEEVNKERQHLEELRKSAEERLEGSKKRGKSAGWFLSIRRS